MKLSPSVQKARQIDPSRYADTLPPKQKPKTSSPLSKLRYKVPGKRHQRADHLSSCGSPMPFSIPSKTRPKMLDLPPLSLPLAKRCNGLSFTKAMSYKDIIALADANQRQRPLMERASEICPIGQISSGALGASDRGHPGAGPGMTLNGGQGKGERQGPDFFVLGYHRRHVTQG